MRWETHEEDDTTALGFSAAVAQPYVQQAPWQIFATTVHSSIDRRDVLCPGK